MPKLRSHTVSRCPLWYLRYFKQRKQNNGKTTIQTPKKQKKTNNQKKNQTKQFSETPQGGAGASETTFFFFFFFFFFFGFWFLAYRKPSTLLIWKYSAPSSKTYMLNSESISETFHLQAALRDTVVTGSSRKESRTLEGRSTNRTNVFTHI